MRFVVRFLFDAWHIEVKYTEMLVNELGMGGSSILAIVEFIVNFLAFILIYPTFPFERLTVFVGIKYGAIACLTIFVVHSVILLFLLLDGDLSEKSAVRSWPPTN